MWKADRLEPRDAEAGTGSDAAGHHPHLIVFQAHGGLELK